MTAPAATTDIKHRPSIPDRIAAIQDDHHRTLADLAASSSGFVDAWLNGRKPATVRSYRAALASLADHMDATEPEALAILFGAGLGPANSIVSEWRSAMAENDLAAATINQRLSAIRSAVGYAGELGLVGWSLKVKSVKAKPYRDTTGPGTKAVAKIVHHLASLDTEKATRDLAIVRLLHDRGLRAGEVVALDLADIDLAGCRVRIIPKGRTEKEPVTVSSAACTAIAAWIEHRGRRPGPLFTNLDPVKPTGRLTTRSVGRLVDAAGVAVGVHGVRPHGLRHSSITTGLDLTGGDHRRVKQHSRHIKVETVGLYDDARADLGGHLAEQIGGHLDQAIADLTAPGGIKGQTTIDETIN